MITNFESRLNSSFILIVESSVRRTACAVDGRVTGSVLISLSFFFFLKDRLRSQLSCFRCFRSSHVRINFSKNFAHAVRPLRKLHATATAADRDRQPDGARRAKEKTAVRYVRRSHTRIRTRRHESTRSRCTYSGIARASVLSSSSS